MVSRKQRLLVGLTVVLSCALGCGDETNSPNDASAVDGGSDASRDGAQGVVEEDATAEGDAAAEEDAADRAPDSGQIVEDDDASASGEDDAGPQSGVFPADILRTCRTTVACQYGPEPGITFDNCLNALLDYRLLPIGANGDPTLRQRIERVVECANRESDCDAYKRCATLAVPRCTSSASGCNGDRSYTCPYNGALPHVTDCQALGLTCEGAGVCVVPASAPSCDASSFVPSCSGQAVLNCGPRAGGGSGERVDPCGAGTACGSIEGGFGRACLPPPSSCTTPGTRCEGGTLVTCTGGIRLERACGAVGLGCGKATSVSVPDCLAETDPCQVPAGTNLSKAVCEASGDITACVHGTTQTLHCPDFGLTTCATNQVFTSNCGG